MYLLFDIGGTKTRLALSKDGETFDEPKLFSTPKSFNNGMIQFLRILNELDHDGKVDKAAGGIRGVLSKDKSKLLNDAFLTDWLNKPLKEELERVVKGPVFLENDTAMIGLGEAAAGAGRGYDIVAYLTVSTGVGGARIINGKIDVSTYNSEPGHQIIDADSSINPDFSSEGGIDGPGHFESLVSGTAFKKRFGKEPHEVNNESIWEEISKLVAYGVNNTIVHWAPDVVVLGGGMMKSPGIILESVKKHLQDILKIYPNIPDIKKAELGDFGGLHGALEYLRQKDD